MNSFKLGSIALAHNGQLVNYEPLREMLEDSGSTFNSTSDTEVILKLIARSYKKGIENAIHGTMQLIKGSYALCILTQDSLIGVRDPNGIRPLCLGKLPEVDGKPGGYILASESCAIDSVNGELIRDIKPGEIIIKISCCFDLYGKFLKGIVRTAIFKKECTRSSNKLLLIIA